MIRESKPRAAKQALGILRSCGVGAASEEKAVRQVLDAYVRSYGKRVTPPVTSVRELLAEYGAQQRAVDLFHWLTDVSHEPEDQAAGAAR